MLDALRPAVPGEMPSAGWETHHGVAFVVLLADYGPSPQLGAALASVLARAHVVEDWDGQLALLQRWVEGRVAGA